MRNKICYIIVSYLSDQQYLEKLIEVLRYEKVIIINNNNSNLIRSQNREHIIINNKINYGYAASCNQGIDIAVKNYATWCVILNDDISITNQTISKLRIILNITKSDILGPYLGYIDSQRYSTILDSKPKKNNKLIYISGSFIVIRLQIIKIIGNFFVPYFMYYEDVDFCIRAQKYNKLIQKIYLPDIIHYDGQSINKGSNIHNYYLSRNHHLFVERQAPILVKLHEIVRIPKTLWEHYKNKDTGSLHGDFDYLFRRFGMRGA